MNHKPDLSRTALAAKSPDPQPWLRFVARRIDLIVYEVLFGVVSIPLFVGLGFLGIDPAFMDSMTFVVVFGVVFFFFVVGAESLILSRWQTTPAKKLLGLTVLKDNGTDLSFRDALNRTLGVWLRGMAVGLPIVTYLAQGLAYANLMQEGATHWDVANGMQVVRRPVGVWRIALGMGIMLLSIGLEYEILYSNL